MAPTLSTTPAPGPEKARARSGPLLAWALAAVLVAGRPSSAWALSTDLDTGGFAGLVLLALFAVVILALILVAIRRESAELSRFKVALEQSLDGVLMVGPDERVLYANRAWARMHGYDDPAGLSGLHVEDFLTPQDYLSESRRLRATILGQGAYQAEVTHRRRDGGAFPVWVSIALLPGGRGREPVAVVLARDMSASREMEARLRESERRLSQMAETIDQVFFLRTPQGLLYVSRTFERLFGLSVESMLADPFVFLSVVHPADLERVRAAYQAFREDAADFNEEFRLLRPDGGQRWVRIRTFPVPDDPEQRVAGVIDDTTERVAFEQDLAQARDEALVAARAKNVFLANMSHEVRTPLNGVLGMLQILEAGQLSPEQRESVDTALASARGLMDVLNDILDYSRIESGRLDLAEYPLDPARFLDSVIQGARPRAAAKGLALDLEVEPGTPSLVLADEVHLRQVLHNLLGNALKYTDQGAVVVSGCWRPAPDGEPGLAAGAGHLVIGVSDTGVGLAEDRLDAVFEPFERGDDSYARRFGGTGLGLGIARGLIRLMGGEILLDSAPGQGTLVEFSVRARLPLAAAPVCEAPAVARECPPAQGLRVLYIEDDPRDRDLVGRFLARLGHAGDSAPNGVLGLERLAAAAIAGRPFDLLLLDIELPELSGEEVLARIRQGLVQAVSPRLPVIVITAHDGPGARERLLAQGVNDFMSKPLSARDLDCAIRRSLTCPATTG